MTAPKRYSSCMKNYFFEKEKNHSNEKQNRDEEDLIYNEKKPQRALENVAVNAYC